MKVLEEGDNDGEPSDLLTARLKAQEMVERFFFVIKKKEWSEYFYAIDQSTKNTGELRNNNMDIFP